MMDIKSVLDQYGEPPSVVKANNKKEASFSQIPDLFFDQILTEFKLSRIEIITLMYLYRLVWCRPNIHRDFGISPMISYEEMGDALNLSMEELYAAIRKFEGLGFIETIRSGQFFVRRYFTEKYDQAYDQNYEAE